MHNNASCSAEADDDDGYDIIAFVTIKCWLMRCSR
jgi:hypothetical protein